MLSRLDLLNLLLLREKPKCSKGVGFCLLIGVIALGVSPDAHSSGEDGTTFTIHQAEEAQKEVNKLLSQDKDIDSIRMSPSSAKQQASPFLNGMKEQLRKIKAESAKIIDRGNLMGGLNTKIGCPSQLFSKEEGTRGNCSSKTVQFPKKEDVLLSEKKDQLLVFVSFSMPEASLKSLAQDAEKYNAVLVMRGLYEDSFVKTANKLKDLGIGVDINPELFETHKVTAVPTFVALISDRPLWCLKGNVTLDFVMKTFKDQHVGDQLAGSQGVTNKRFDSYQSDSQRIGDQGKEKRS